tara:strand:+ start:292 stop:699 length:408 start_codon:yes stop_codon:yes gene_type:complete
MPRITHETILVYGKTGQASVGVPQSETPQKKGTSSIGKDKLGARVYTPKPRKQLNSVQSFPRNMSNPLGCWGKPLPLMFRLLEWVDADTIFDPFMGSGTTLRAAKDLGRKATGVELEEKYCEIAAKRLAQEVLAL